MSMKRSVEQLLKELEDAKSKVPDNTDILTRNEPDIPTHMLEWEFGEEKTIGEWLGVSRTAFPSKEQLTDQEIETLTAKIIDVWDAFHFIPDIPSNLPIHLIYERLLNLWEEKTQVYTIGHTHFELYSYEELESSLEIND